LRDNSGPGFVFSKTHFASVNEIDVTRAITTWRSRCIILHAWRIRERDYTKTSQKRSYGAAAVAWEEDRMANQWTQSHSTSRWYVSPKPSIECNSSGGFLVLSANRRASTSKTRAPQSIELCSKAQRLSALGPSSRPSLESRHNDAGTRTYPPQR